MISLCIVPSLKHITLNKIAIAVCNQSVILHALPSILNFVLNQSDIMKKWYTQNRIFIKAKIDNFCIPEAFKTELLDTIYEVLCIIYDWICTNYNNTALYNFFMKNFHLVAWTPLGEIDSAKSVYNVLKCNVFDDGYRYHVACSYSFHDIVYELRPKIVSSFCHETFMTCNWQYDLLKSYWVNEEENCYDIEYLFISAVEIGNLSAVKYFFEKIPPDEKSNIMRQTTKRLLEGMNKSHYHRGNKIYSLNFVLSHLTAEQQEGIFETHGSRMLQVFLSWPLLVLLPFVVEHLLRYVPPSEIYKALCIISFTTTSNVLRRNTFKSIWNACSTEAKNHVIQNILIRNDLLPKMKKNNDESNIWLLLSYVSEEKRVKIKEVLVQYDLHPWSLNNMYVLKL